MVHISVARNWNLVLKDASNDSTPTSHNSFNSSTKGCKYTSIAIPGEVGPGITSDKIKEDLFMHIQGERLYETKTTGHVLCMVLMFPYGLNPSVANPSLTLWGSDANSTYLSSNSFQASKSAGCLITPSFVRPVACHFILVASSDDRKSCCNLDFKENQCRTFTAFFLLLLDETYVLSGTGDSDGFHLDTSQCGQASRLHFPSNKACNY